MMCASDIKIYCTVRILRGDMPAGMYTVFEEPTDDIFILINDFIKKGWIVWKYRNIATSQHHHRGHYSDTPVSIYEIVDRDAIETYMKFLQL